MGNYPVDWSERSRVVRSRDSHRCSICGRSGVELHVHHVVPLSEGGSSDPSNLLSVCVDCHRSLHKGDRPVPDLSSASGFYCLSCDRFFSVGYGRAYGICPICGSALRPWADNRRD